jgi:hypothetical protein
MRYTTSIEIGLPREKVVQLVEIMSKTRQARCATQPTTPG